MLCGSELSEIRMQEMRGSGFVLISQFAFFLSFQANVGVSS